MDIDLKGKAPKVQTLEEAQKVIKTLWSLLREKEEKKNTNSKNSSLPPSKDQSSKNKSNVRRTEQRKKNSKKHGGQPGHQKHERRLLPESEVDKVIRCSPANSCDCGGNIINDTTISRRHQQYEFPVIKPFVTEYQLYGGQCDCCHKIHRAKLPVGISWSMLGPRATAMTAHLSGTYRISKQNIVNMYEDIFNFSISIGMVCKAERTVSKSLENPVEEAKEFVQAAENVSVHADETSFKEKGKKMWAWIAITCHIAVFIIRKSRGKKVAQELLGSNFMGMLCSDRYSAYQWIPASQRQICWAHLDRDFRKIAERSGTSGEIGCDLLKQTDKLFHYWHQFKEGIIDRTTLKRKTRPIQIFIEGLLRRGRYSKNKNTAGTCRNILSYQPALWLFLEKDGIEPTNNLAEQLIRTLAIWRKTSFGTQSEAGTLYMERIMTVVATCKLQKRNILSYLTDAVKSYVGNTKAPSLLTNLSAQQESASQLAA